MSDAIAEGKAAWATIRGSGKTTFDAWLKIGAALLVLRSQAMQAARSNSPFGPRYQSEINRLLQAHDLQGIDSHERRSSIVLAENREAVTKWRERLSDAE